MSAAPTSLRYGIVAYVAPFILYIVPTMVESKGWFGLSYEYETVCTLKGLLAGAALWVFRREYPPFTTTGFLLAIVAGVVGCGIWVVLDRVQGAIPGIQALVDTVNQGGRVGYDPFAGSAPATIRRSFLIVRLIEMAMIVPVMEEVFWRGFLARHLLADDFRNAPQGVFTALSFAMVTLAFASVHPELLAAIAWGSLINLLYRRTANLWSCVVMHAATNGLLACYILATGSWHLW